ncbi:uncharacterized protein ACRADG_002013 [Cochliomyia hominivorax]
MFKILEIITTTSKFSCNKLLLLSLIINISPLSYELEQQNSEATPATSSSSSSLVQQPEATDNLIVKRDFELIFENFTCLLNHKWVANTKLKQSVLMSEHHQNMEKLSCCLTKNAKRRYLQMDMTFKRQINQFYFNILIILQRPHHFQQPQFVLMNLTSLNGCDMLALKNQVTLMHWARNALQHYSNFPQKCPFKAHNPYYIRNLKWDMEQIPSFYIEAPIKIEFSYIFDNSRKVEGFIVAKLELKSNKKFSL